MVSAQQYTSVPISSAQASLVGLQAATVPATTTNGFDINSIMNMMVMLVVVVMMMKVMTGVTERV